MAASIRRSALDAVGGYDERLSYEDYDMWLRLAARYDFAYCQGVVARYRIVSSSLVRTLFVRPTAHHSHTVFLIRQRWLRSSMLSPAQRRAWAELLWQAAYNLYYHDDRRSRIALWEAFRFTRKPRALALALTSSIGLSRSRMKRWLGMPAEAVK